MGSGDAARRELSFEEAERAVLGAVPILRARCTRERVPLDASMGRLLAAPFHAPGPFPRFSNSAVDGYAVRAAEVAGATRDHPVRLPVAETVPAGRAPRPLRPGCCARVMTGAPLPEGADSVVMREQTDDGAVHVSIVAAPAPGENVRPAGEDAAQGELVIPAGRTLSGREIAALGAFGLEEIEVVARPRVAILSTGDELRAPGESLAPGEVYDSNSHALRALVWEAGGAVTTVLRLPDDAAAVLAALRLTLAENDLVLSIGGVSMGDYDPVKQAILEIEGIELWRVAMRPGGPQAFGATDGCLLYGLPGNPVSSAVVFDRLVRRLLRSAMGAESIDHPVRRARLEESVSSKRGRRDFVRLRLTETPAGLVARLTGTQSSGAVTSLARADGLGVVREQDDRLAPGSEIEVLLWRES